MEFLRILKFHQHFTWSIYIMYSVTWILFMWQEKTKIFLVPLSSFVAQTFLNFWLLLRWSSSVEQHSVTNAQVGRIVGRNRPHRPPPDSTCPALPTPAIAVQCLRVILQVYIWNKWNEWHLSHLNVSLIWSPQAYTPTPAIAVQCLRVILQIYIWNNVTTFITLECFIDLVSTCPHSHTHNRYAMSLCDSSGFLRNYIQCNACLRLHEMIRKTRQWHSSHLNASSERSPPAKRPFPQLLCNAFLKLSRSLYLG